SVSRGLLGMELDPEHVFPGGDRGESLAVLGAADDVAGIARPGRERVHVVEGAALGWELCGQRRGALEAHLVPADVRDAQASGLKASDLAADQPEPRRSAHLL